MSGLLYRLGALCTRRRALVIGVWVLVILVVGGSRLHFGALTGNDVTLPGTGAQRASDLLRRQFPPHQNSTSPIVFHVSDGTVTDPGNRQAIEAALRAIAANPHVNSVLSPFSPAGRTLKSADGKTAVAQVLLDVNGLQLTKDVATQVFAEAAPARRAGIQVEAGGAIGARISEEHSRRSEEIGIAVAIVILAVTFGALVAAGLPIVTALVGLVVGLSLIGLLGHVANIPTTAPILATMIGLGVGIDYALFIVFRHRDQLQRGMEVKESVVRAMATSGSAVVFAGGTVIIALLALLVARVPLLGAMGYAAALTVAVAVLTAVTFLPTMLGLLGHRIDALRIPGLRRGGARQTEDGVWARWAGLVTRHPWLALAASLAVLVPLIVPTLSLRLGQEDLGVMPATTTQRRAFDLISAGLRPGANGPLVVATELRPPAQASAAYTDTYDAALKLKARLQTGRRRLTKRAAALKREGAALAAQQRGLTARAAALQGRTYALQAQGAALQRQKAQLLAEQARLAKQQARLTAEGQTLAANKKALAARGSALTSKGATLQAEIAAVQQQLAGATDPAAIAQLQAQLASLLQQAQQLQAQKAELQRQGAALAARGAALAAQGKTLEAQGKALQAQGNALSAQATTLTSQGAGLAAQGAQLTAKGDALKARGTSLQKSSAGLKRQERRLRQQARRATSLKADLTRMLTQAGGQPLATDPRMVHLQTALASAPGVVSVSPPRVNKSGTAAVLSVTAATRPADPKTVDLVKRLRGEVIPAAARGTGMTVYVGGVTAAYVDLAALISRRLPLVIATVLTLSFILLTVAFRSVLVPFKAVVCNLLAVGAAFGVLTAVFQWGWGLRFIGLQNPYGTVPIASYVPLLMFAVLFGLSTDYEVFLITQIFQSHAAGEGPHQAVRSGVGTSARVITAAALIMVAVFASFILRGDPIIKQFGVGLSIAILLDATIVRMVIVPATMVLLGEWNWYLPRWLEWLPRTEVPEEATELVAAAGRSAEDLAAAAAGAAHDDVA